MANALTPIYVYMPPNRTGDVLKVIAEPDDTDTVLNNLGSGDSLTETSVGSGKYKAVVDEALSGNHYIRIENSNGTLYAAGCIKELKDTTDAQYVDLSNPPDIISQLLEEIGYEGTYDIKVTVENSSGQGVEGVRVWIDGTDKKYTTGTDGKVDIPADEGSYTLKASPPSFYHTPSDTAVTVDGSDEPVTITLTPVATISAPSDPGLCRIGAYLKESATGVQNGTFKAKLLQDNSGVDGTVLSLQVLSDTTDATGYAELQLVRLDQFTVGDGKYRIWLEDPNGKVVADIMTTVPNESTYLLEDLIKSYESSIS